MTVSTLALPQGEMTYWTVVLVIGLVVIIAVVVLLSLLIWFVKIIDNRVVEVRDTLRDVSGNTENAKLIPQTADGVDLVLAEGLKHHLFLGRALEATGASTGNGEAQ
jgi:hypothetical protein